MRTVGDIYNIIDRHIGFKNAESWDNCGILVGNRNSQVEHIITTLDISCETVREAVEKKAQLIVSHHPVIFLPRRSIDSESAEGMMLKNGISAICVHTPFDMAEEGMNKGLYDILKKPLGLSDESRPLEQTGENISIGKIYQLDVPLDAQECGKRLKAALGCSVVRYNDSGRKIGCIAISSGAGNSFVELAQAKGADALVSGDFKHDSFITARDIGLTLFDCGHFHTERIFTYLMKNILESELSDVKITEAESCTDPVKYI